MGKRREDEEMLILRRANDLAEWRIQQETGEPSIHEQMWRLLDHQMDRLMKDGQPTSVAQSPAGQAVLIEYGESKGVALGIAECLTIIGKPLVVTVDDVRDEAMRRWEVRQKQQEQPKPKRKKARK